jgi:hypothetical protein
MLYMVTAYYMDNSRVLRLPWNGVKLWHPADLFPAKWFECDHYLAWHHLPSEKRIFRNHRYSTFETHPIHLLCIV